MYYKFATSVLKLYKIYSYYKKYKYKCGSGNMNKMLFTPGPTNVPEDIRRELAKDMIHHRTADFEAIFDGLGQKLKKIFKTEEDVISLGCSGTGVMETSVVNLFSRGEKVLVINAGYFGERFGDISRVFGLEVIELKYAWGKSYNLDEVKEVIKNNPDLKGILVQYSETSTGVLHNVKALGELTKDTDILLVVDNISALVVNPFEFDGWSVDCSIAGSQKGFFMPPGLSFITLSKKAKEAMKKSDLPKFYFDLKKYYKALEGKQSPWTPPIGLIMAADYSCKKILDRGLETIQAHHKDLREYVEKELTALGFGLFVEKEENRGNTLVSLLGNDKIDTKVIIKRLDLEYNYSVAGGQGEYVGKLMRVGCIGELTKEDIVNLVNAIKTIVSTM